MLMLNVLDVAGPVMAVVGLVMTIFPDEPGGHFGNCADKYHDYPWLDEEPVCPSCGKKIDENVQSLGLMVVEICIDDFHLRPWPTREKP